MKTFLRLSLVTLSLMFFFNFLTTKEAKAQSAVNDILKRMVAHQNSLSSLRSNVMMEKYNSQLKEEYILEGTAIYSRTAKSQTSVRIDWTKPVVESLSITNDRYVFYRPRLQQAFIGKIDKAIDKAMENVKIINALFALSFVQMSSKEIKVNHIIKYLGDETIKGGTKTWRLVLTPKKPASYQSAELWVDGNGMPRQAKIVEPNNDATTILLSNFKKNEKINFIVFQLKLPKGTKIIESPPYASPSNIVRDNKEKAVKNTAPRKRVKKLPVRKKRLRLGRVKTAR